MRTSIKLPRPRTPGRGEDARGVKSAPLLAKLAPSGGFAALRRGVAQRSRRITSTPSTSATSPTRVPGASPPPSSPEDRGEGSVVCALLSLLLVAGCYRDDMADDGHLKPMEESPFFADGNLARPLINGTVPRGGQNASTTRCTR